MYPAYGSFLAEAMLARAVLDARQSNWFDLRDFGVLPILRVCYSVGVSVFRLCASIVLPSWTHFGCLESLWDAPSFGVWSCVHSSALPLVCFPWPGLIGVVWGALCMVCPEGHVDMQ